MARTVHFILAAAGLVVLPALGSGQELKRTDDGWSRYRNERFGFAVDVPSAFTPVDPPSDNGDGRIFRSADGAELRVFGSYGATTVAQDFTAYKALVLNQLRQGGVNVTYRAQGNDWFAASGTKGGDIVYMKMVDGCGATHEAWLTYPVALRASYDPLVSRVARSLRCVAPPQ